MFYTGKLIPSWTGDALISGLSSEAIVRVRVENGTAREVERIDMGERIRDLAQAPDGALWVLQDGSDAKLLRMAP
jgi:glucose/arabinose dehydrogenase